MNDQLVPKDPENSRVMMQVQAQVLMAKQFPRDVEKSREEILKICENPKMASIATYAYNRGTTNIERPSIKLVKAMALAWGNLDYSWYEIERRMGDKKNPGESHIVVYCWDLQTNTRPSRTFIVRHWRDTDQGGYAVTSERDIYEQCANMASRRMRECILDVIPKYIEEEVVEAVKETMKKEMGGSSDATVAERAQTLFRMFSEVGVSAEMLENKIGRGTEDMIMSDIIKYQGIYMTIKDGDQRIESFFPSEKKADTADTGESKGKRPLPEKKNTKPAEERPTQELTKEEKQEQSTDGIDWSIPENAEGLHGLFDSVWQVYEGDEEKAEELGVFLDREPIDDIAVEFYEDYVSQLKKIVSA